jgi:hypothetical protein
MTNVLLHKELTIRPKSVAVVGGGLTPPTPRLHYFIAARRLRRRFAFRKGFLGGMEFRVSILDAADVVPFAYFGSGIHCPTFRPDRENTARF